MTEQQNTNTATSQAINLILENGLDGLAGAIAVLIDQAMLIERSNHIGAGPYERHADRDGHANGFKPKTLQTRVGKIEVSIPQVRGSTDPFYPSAFERGQRSEVAEQAGLVAEGPGREVEDDGAGQFGPVLDDADLASDAFLPR